MSALGSIFGGGASAHAYDPATAQMIGPEGGNYGQQFMAQQGNINNQQQDFANALKQQASGQGPSVANEQLKQALQQQQSGAAASAAGARGVNPALAMRTAMEQQGQAGQASAQSGAIARAGEALGAQGQLGAQLGTMANQNLQSQNMNLEAQRANQQAGLQAQGMTMGAGQAQNQAQQGMLSGIGSGLMMMSKGGAVPHYDNGAVVAPPPTESAATPSAPGANAASIIGRMLGGTPPPKAGGPGAQKPGGLMSKLLGSSGPTQSYEDITSNLSPQFMKKGLTQAQANTAAGAVASDQGLHPMGPTMGFGKGGKVPAMVSPGEIRVPAGKAKDPREAQKYAASAAKSGKRIAGKAKVDGDSLQNDTVPKNLNEGDIIVPRSKAKDPNDAAAFVRALLASQRKGQS